MARYLSIISLLSALLAVAEPLSFDLATSSGWNLVAVPISIANDPETFFAPGPAWEWTGARFESAKTIVPGKAYWVYQSAARSNRTVTGAAVEVVTRELQAGWNLIGGIGYPPYADLPLPLRTETAGAIVRAWGWENGKYVRLSRLPAGTGAWVYATQACTVRLCPNPELGGVKLAYSSAPDKVRLQWATGTDDRTSPSALSYTVYGPPPAARATTIGAENALATVNGSSTIISGLNPNTAYDFTIAAEDADGNTSYFNETVTVTTAAAAQLVNTAGDTQLTASDARTTVDIPSGFLVDNDGGGVDVTVLGLQQPPVELAAQARPISSSAVLEVNASAVPDNTDAQLQIRLPVPADREAFDPAYTTAVIRIEFYDEDDPDTRYVDQVFGVAIESAGAQRAGAGEYLLNLSAKTWGAAKASATTVIDATRFAAGKVKAVVVATVVLVRDVFVWTAKEALEIGTSVYQWTRDQLPYSVDLSIARWDPVFRRFCGETTSDLGDRQVVVFLHGWQTLAGFADGVETSLRQPLLAGTLIPQDREGLHPEVTTWTPLANYATGAAEGSQFGDLRQDYVFYTVRYDSDKRVYENALAIRQLLSERFPDRKVTIIAHSMGGIVARAMDQKYHPDGIPFAEWPNGGTERIISLNTPYHGTPFIQFVHKGLDVATVASLVTGDIAGAVAMQEELAFLSLTTPGTFDLAWDNFNGDPSISANKQNVDLLELNQAGPADLSGRYFTTRTSLISADRSAIEWALGNISGPVIAELGYANDGIVPVESAALNGYDGGYTPRTREVGSTLPGGVYDHLKVYAGDESGDQNDDNYDERMFDEILAALTLGVTGLSISSATVSLPPGTKQAFTATATFSDGSTVDVTGDLAFTAAPVSAGSFLGATFTAAQDAPDGLVTIEATYGGQTSTASLTVDQDAVPPAGDYLIINVSGGPTASSYPLTNLTFLPNPIPEEYKTTKIVLRRIPAGTFTMGSPSDELGWSTNETQHSVTLTQDVYVGVFEVTQRQWELVMGNRPAYFSSGSWEQRPVEQVSYNDIRGSSAGTGWPAGNGVDAASFLGRLRARTGHTFDLPTEAQWEYACRAGTTSALNNGTNLQSTGSDPNMDLLGRYWYNGGSNYSSDPISGGSAVVGSYLPNQWGLYDMHGNVWEWCLDWYQSALGTSAVSDPVGASSGSIRVFRGGNWHYNAWFCRSALRFRYRPGLRSWYDGLRLALPAGQ
jgi:formylglycine-generating enzyme required for sulfatase activity/pimeloyl-ACP methyl ester carboxylesterase